MFLINGTPLSKSEFPDEFNWLEEKKEEIRSAGKKSYMFTAFNGRSKLLREDGRYVPQKDRRRIVSMVGATSDATGKTVDGIRQAGVHQTWAYATGMNALKSDDAQGYTLKRSTMALGHDNEFSIIKDIELIVFFTLLSQNKNIKEVDYAKNSRIEAEANALHSKAYQLVYGEDSPIHPTKAGSEQPLRNISLSWGITNALDMDVYALMSELWTRVQQSQEKINQTKKGFATFIENVEQYGDSNKIAAITLAIQKGVVVYDSSVWKMVSPDGKDQFLCGVPYQDEANKESYVMKYILGEKIIFEAMLSILENTTDSVKQVMAPAGPNKSEQEVLEELTRGDLIKKAQELGWVKSHYKEVAKKSNEELISLIIEKKTPELVEEN